MPYRMLIGKYSIALALCVPTGTALLADLTAPPDSWWALAKDCGVGLLLAMAFITFLRYAEQQAKRHDDTLTRQADRFHQDLTRLLDGKDEDLAKRDAMLEKVANALQAAAVQAAANTVALTTNTQATERVARVLERRTMKG